MDGTQWALEIALSGHALKTHGNNNYPKPAGRPNNNPHSTKAFNDYLAAVKKLLGGRTFQ